MCVCCLSQTLPAAAQRVAHLGLNETVLGARDEHEALDFEEVPELGRVDLAHAERVRLFVRALDDVAQMRDQGEVVR